MNSILQGDTSHLGVWDNNAMVWRHTNSSRVVTPEEVLKHEDKQMQRDIESLSLKQPSCIRKLFNKLNSISV